MNNPIPNLGTAEILEGYQQFVVPSYARFPVAFVRGKGSYVWDAEDRRYLDFCGGIAVNVLGHASSVVGKALGEAAGRLIHCSNLYYHPAGAQLAEALVRRIGAGKMFFSNSGAEANECLFKLARRYGASRGAFEILTAQGSFHGRTLAAMAATGQEKVREGFGPPVPGFRHVPFLDLAAAERAIGPATAAILVEPIQGEGGVRPATAAYLQGLRRICDRHGLLLLLDEVQTGSFRSGRFLAFQRILESFEKGNDFLPDGIAMAKGLAGGYPMGATWIREPYAELLGPGSHASTFGGSPLACAVALAVLRHMEEQDLGRQIREKGERLRAELEALASPERRLIRSVSGVGGLWGLHVRRDARSVALELMDRGLLVAPAAGNIVRLLPPLTVSEDEISEAVAILRAASRDEEAMS
ncbi:acetylornithine/N-succinyldiaminopimelate aminotransferase [Methylacidimicrobium cyclopophantes]|uniref:Acetylornithine/N-succinyldiaminopimelate aminotransferase n=1 Tax=Methylacidimicrobium cyclopophantes TaxID=1041766 RepID=A0A5E6M7U8_9BACT|nr:acetylornithine transaminase [Methylacidimicrobium cyclopophantes]VVM05433.1 acetylornithine/N-succinyldiaminopimelate aminotransferase [Methylacidimicrobium cyclopophantes]